MAITLLLPTSKHVRLVKAEQTICHDSEHSHNSPIQNMISAEIDGHFVEVTQDGDTFSARIDECLTRFNLTPDQLDQFIKDNT